MTPEGDQIMATVKPDAYSKESWEAIVPRLPEHAQSEHAVMQALYAEHRYMATLMHMLGEQLAALETGNTVDPHVLYEVMHYMTHFPDAFHHPREDMVYQRAAELDPELADSVDTLQRDHDYLSDVGAKALKSIDDWRDGRGKDEDLLKHCQNYASSLYEHMNTEEKVVFPQIEKLLSEEDWFELEQQDLLSPVPDPVFGTRVDREYRNIARKARRALRRGAEDAAVVEWIGIEALLEGVEVLSMAVDNSRAAADDRFSEARDDMKELFQESLDGEASLLLLPARCSLSNVSHYVGWLKDCGAIVKDAAGDIRELNRGMRQRMRWVTDAPDNAEHTVH
jgi:hemerythrin-like domain-containing protein